MTAADSKSNLPMTLADLLEAAGIQEYAGWSHCVDVLPSGRADFKPRSYQVSGLNHMAAFLPRSAIYDDPGTGKTLQIQAFAQWMAGLGNKIVVVMLPGLVRQFRESLRTTFPGSDQALLIDVLDGDPDKRQKKIDSYVSFKWPDILIMSYGTFRGRDKAPKRAPVSKKQEAELAKLTPEEAIEARKVLVEAHRAKTAGDDAKFEWLPNRQITALNLNGAALEYAGYNLLIADEAHELKNPESSIHIAVRDFVKPWDKEKGNGLVLATGSPIETNVEDAYGLISLIDCYRYGSKRTFDSEHCVMLPETRFRKVIEYINLDYLYQSLYARGRRITKREAFPDMPSRVVTELSVPLSKDHQALYRKLVDEQVLVLDDKLIDATQAQRMYQFCQQILLCPEKFADKPPKENALMEVLVDLIKSADGRKLIVFAWYQDSISKLKSVFQKLNPAVINGNVTGAARDREKFKFINDDTCRLLIANPESGGVGLDGFQHVCSSAIFAEVYPHPGGFEQAIGRIERSGQTESINITLLVSPGTIAVKLRNDLCRKEAYANDVVRDKKTLIADMLGEEGVVGTIE